MLFKLLTPFLFIAISFPLIGNNIAMQYEISLDKEEKQLQTVLYIMAGIQTEKNWNKFKKSLESDYEKDCTESTNQELANKPLTDNLIEPIINTLNQGRIINKLGIKQIIKSPDSMSITAYQKSGKNITIMLANKKLQSCAATDQHNLLIEPKELFNTHKNNYEIEATIAHELIHIAKQDDFNLYCLNKASKSLKRRIRRKFKQIKAKWERIQEKRADILAGLINWDYAIASTNQFKRTKIKHEKLLKTSTHPTDNQRYEYMNKLIKSIERNNSSLLSIIFAIIFSAIFMFSALIFIKKAQ